MATPWRDALTRSIGTEPHVDIDVFGPFPVKPDTALVICSDGLYKTLSDADVRRIYLQSSSPQEAAQTLVNEALDLATDARLRAALRPHTADAAVLIVAQRVSTIIDAHQILVLEDGEIIGRGTHAELLETCPTYAEIVESQIGQGAVA